MSNENPEIIAGCRPVEYLNSSGARNDRTNKPFVVVTVRLAEDPQKPFKPTNLAIPKDVAQRLVKDLQRALMSPLMVA